VVAHTFNTSSHKARQADLLSLDQHGLLREFQDSQGYTENPSLKKKKKKNKNKKQKTKQNNNNKATTTTNNKNETLGAGGMASLPESPELIVSIQTEAHKLL
jgi:ribosomal protein S21